MLLTFRILLIGIDKTNSSGLFWVHFHYCVICSDAMIQSSQRGKILVVPHDFLPPHMRWECVEGGRGLHSFGRITEHSYTGGPGHPCIYQPTCYSAIKALTHISLSCKHLASVVHWYSGGWRVNYTEYDLGLGMAVWCRVQASRNFRQLVGGPTV